MSEGKCWRAGAGELGRGEWVEFEDIDKLGRDGVRWKTSWHIGDCVGVKRSVLRRDASIS